MIGEGHLEIIRRTQRLPDPNDPLTGLGATMQWFFGMKPLIKQSYFHHAAQRKILYCGGVGGGKTATAMASSTAYCLTIPQFRYLHTAPTSYQARLGYEWLMQRINANERLQDLVLRTRQKPYPLVEWKTSSTQEFITAGFEGSAIRGSEFDWINYDEGGLDARLKATLVALESRLRGLRPDGTPRMARFSITTTPTDVPALRDRWDRGVDPQHPEYDPTKFLSMRVTIYDNPYIPQWQKDEIFASMTPEDRDVDLYGHFPEGLGSIFRNQLVNDAIDAALNDVLDEAIEEARPGYDVRRAGYSGILRYEVPREQGRTYVLGGDPGVGTPPHRNAPCVIVLDVTEKPFTLVYFDWIDGGGRYRPFLESFRYAKDKYHPLFSGIDSTGPQMMMNELAFEEHGIEVDSINFSRDKMGMVNATRMLLGERQLRMPLLTGLSRQLKQYELDDRDLAQDTVCALMMCAHLGRFVHPEQAATISSRAQRLRTAYRVARRRGRRTRARGR